jgi:hypothetical protein
MRLRRPEPIGRERLPEQEPAQWQRLTDGFGIRHEQTWIGFDSRPLQPGTQAPTGRTCRSVGTGCMGAEDSVALRL